MCTHGPVSVHLSMCSALWGCLVLGENGALVNRYILSALWVPLEQKVVTDVCRLIIALTSTSGAQIEST